MPTKSEPERTAICPNCTSLDTYSNTPGYWRCLRCGAVWSNPRFPR